ncbi:MAG: hypothetical protein IT243_02995 [Bacteroidia bacterium]|nr:hypothetical protein [Bacteroidia bacterium]
MRIILLIILIVYQINCYSQQITQAFDSLLYVENFFNSSDKWEQRSSDKEFIVISDGYYFIQNKNTDNFLTSMHKPYSDFANYSVSVSLKADDSKSIQKSIGLLVNANPEGNSALVCEINSKNQYRIRQFSNGKWHIISNSGDNGWIKSKKIKSKSFNEITLNTSDGIFDFYINSHFIFSFVETKFKSGNIGFFVNKNSSGKFDYIKIFNSKTAMKINETAIENTDVISENKNKEFDSNDKEIILILKAKIDKQHKKISELNSQLEKCKTQNNTDTSLERKNIELTKQNEKLLIEKGKIEIELRKSKELLAEFEILKKTIEEDKNGDVILSLNEILNRERKKNEELTKAINELKEENKQLLNQLKDINKE